MKEWRLQHPKATLRQIEGALDERLGKMRARMLQDAALASAAADIRTAQASERPVCANVTHVMSARARSSGASDRPMRLRTASGCSATLAKKRLAAATAASSEPKK